MQKIQDSAFSILKTTSLSPAVFSYLQPTEEFTDKTPLGGILLDSKHGWLALGPKFCVVDLRSGLKVAARTFGNGLSSRISVTSVVELPTPLTENTQQLIISLECDNILGMICVFHINGSQLLRCIQTDVVVTKLAVCDEIPSGPFTCFDGLLMAGTQRGEIFVFDLNRSSLLQALKDISQGYEHLVHGESNTANLVFLPLKALHKIEGQREMAVENDDHLAVLLNETSLVDKQYIFRNPDGSVRMKAKKDHIRVTAVKYIPQLGSVIVGFNFGAFQIWNLLNLDLEFTSQVNVECLPVTHFGFQEPCDDPRAFCYLWVVFSVIDRFEEEEFPLAVMYSLTYQGKRMLSDTKCLYQEFSSATIRFQLELGGSEDDGYHVGGRCVSCHTYSVSSTLGDEGEDSMLNLCQLVWECWGEHEANGSHYGMLLFDLDQWYKDQMPATQRVESNTFMSVSRCAALSGAASCVTLDARVEPATLTPYSHPNRLEEHFYPNSLQYSCICLNTSEAIVLHTAGIQRQIIASLEAAGPGCLLAPARLYVACRAAGLAPLYPSVPLPHDQDDQRRFILCVALEGRLSRFLRRCAHDWATGTHAAVGCTLALLVDWCWQRAIELKENAKELTAPLFTTSNLPDRNMVRCLEHCVQQLTQLTGLLDAILTKCCNLIVPDALSEIEEKHLGVGTVSLYLQVVQWMVGVGLVPERHDEFTALPYPAAQLRSLYDKRRLKLNRLQDKSSDENTVTKSCSLLYIDQLIEHEFGGETIHEMWEAGGGGGGGGGLYPAPTLGAVLRLYLAPHIAHEHKHSLLLYLLLDYSMIYDDLRYEAVIRRLMQFPTMFGLSNTAIKATQAFWHLDHRDFDFALDQLQCLTGNTLSDWQHNVVLSSLLAQKKTQAALQYLHVRKPAPVQNKMRDKNGEVMEFPRANDHDKLEDWQCCCNLYLARGLVFEALDVVRMCVQSAGTLEDKLQVLNFFFRGCRNSGQLSKVLQVTLSPFEEEVFIKYLQNCNEPQTSDILVIYYLQQARYIEAEQYNKKLKARKADGNEDLGDARDALVDVVCAALPNIANVVAAATRTEFEPHIIAPKPMSVYVKASSPKNTFTYKSSFIQDTIENASETWMNRPKMRRGMKRALNIEDTPFICTPKLSRKKSIFTDQMSSEATPPKRAKLDLSGTPKTPKTPALKVSAKLTEQMAKLLDMPDVRSPVFKYDRSGAHTPQSILKTRRLDSDRELASPVDSRYLADTDDDGDTASNHTQFSDSTNKHLRFTIPMGSDGSTPSPDPIPSTLVHMSETERKSSIGPTETGNAEDDKGITDEPHPMESPPKKFAAEGVIQPKKSYKDTVKARRSLSISANSSLSDDPNTSIESIADIPITLLNPLHSAHARAEAEAEAGDSSMTPVIQHTVRGRREKTPVETIEVMDSSADVSFVPRTPKGRQGIRNVSESTPILTRSRSVVTPERQDHIIISPSRATKATRSRSRTPELSPRALTAIEEQPALETPPPLQPHTLAPPIPRRSRSRTPEKSDKTVLESPKLETIKESPTKSESPASPSRRPNLSRSDTPEKMDITVLESPEIETIKDLSSKPDTLSDLPTHCGLRSRSHTPEVEIPEQPATISSPRSLRSRSKTPEKLKSPKKEYATRSKKSLSRMVLEANTFAKTKQNTDKMETETDEVEIQSAIESTPMKSSKDTPSLMDVTFSPIVNKSILQSSSESIFSVTTEKVKDDSSGLKPLPAFTTINEISMEKSILRSYESSIAETSSIQEDKSIQESKTNVHMKSLPGFTTLQEMGKSVLHSFNSTADNGQETKDQSEIVKDVPFAFKTLNDSELGKSVLGSRETSVAETSDDSIVKENISKGVLKDNMSSLMTSDSDIEMKDSKLEDTSKTESQDNEKEKVKQKEIDTERVQDQQVFKSKVGRMISDNIQIKDSKREWQSKIESQDTARVIQKEKEKIVEIERELNEIEGEMSDECRGESDSGEEEVLEGIEEEESDVESSDEEDSDENDSSEEDEVISIDDSDRSTSKSDSLQIDENSSEPTQNEVEELETVERIIDIQVEKESKSKEIDNLVAEKETKEDKDNNVKADTEKQEKIVEIQVENVEKGDEISNMDVEETNPLDQAQMSMLTDDNSVVESDQSVNLNYSDEKNEKEELLSKGPEPHHVMEPVIPVVHIEVVVEEMAPIEDIKKNVDTVPIDIDVVDATSEPFKSIQREKDNVPILGSVSKSTVTKDTESKNVETKSKETGECETQVAETQPKPKEVKGTEQKTSEVEVPRTPITRKRTKSTSSNKSVRVKEIEESESKIKEINPVEEPKTPMTRKRTQSNASKKSELEKTPEETPGTSRGQSKSPTSARKILTRRASKELSDKLDESDSKVEELTPRRSTRVRNKNIDDNASIASGSSVKSTKKSEEDKPIRKGRKSVLSTKPDLSVIPEVEKEDAKAETGEVVDYSSVRRLTRNQKAVLESWLEPRPSASPSRRQPSASPSRRRPSATSAASVASLASCDTHDDDDASSTRSVAFDVQPLDRITLLNKMEFEGALDDEDLERASMDSYVASSYRSRQRLVRAASESKTATPKAARISRRMSADIRAATEGSELSPAGADSGARGRRASFHRACEALHTPKGRRTSTDAKSTQGSERGSPAASEGDVTPARRTRKPSTQSNTSQSKPNTGRRSKKAAEKE